MTTMNFADVVHQSITFRSDLPWEKIVLQLMDTKWFQRLRDISQTANTRLVYMFSEHSRFGHSMGVSYLANLLVEQLSRQHGDAVAPYRSAVNAAALLHDIAHLAPGSHTAYKTWFPGQPDRHEELASKVILEDQEIHSILDQHEPGLANRVCAILQESEELPPWTWEIISGGGWNADRGNWCIVDSIMAGVSYGQYNIPALIESIDLAPDGHLVLRENRLDAMMHFALSRHALYRQVYQHRVLLATDTMNSAIAARAKHLLAQSEKPREFMDDTMLAVLRAKSPQDLSLENINGMRESWWRYHLFRWSHGEDATLRDLAERLLNRRLLKTIRVRPSDHRAELLDRAQKAVVDSGYDPKYYLHEVSTKFMHGGDFHQSMLVLLDDGSTRPMATVEPLFETLVAEPENTIRSWIVLPAEAKKILGRDR